MSIAGLCLYYSKIIEKAFSLDKKVGNAPECRMSHHKIKNIFQSEKRPDFDVKIHSNDFFNKYVVYRMIYMNN